MLAPQTVLQNRYRVKHMLGKGGEGAVYLAVDEQNNIEVALKECVIIEDRLRRQFERVARMLASLRHPALPDVIDNFAENNTHFLVMEYVPGDDLLETRAKRGSAFSTDEVLEWADQLLDALEYLHSHQPPIIHRDIKPQNIKLTDKGKVVLLDFGLSKRDASSIGLGTLSYAPLEQLLGKGTDARSDLYSLAATLYHLMTGLQPANAWVRFNEPPDRLRPANKVNKLISPAVADVLNMTLSLDRDGRPTSAAEMRRMLRDGSSQPVPAKESDQLPIVVGSPAVGTADQNRSPESDAEAVPDDASSVFEFETVTLDVKGNVTERRKGQARHYVEDLGGVTIEMVEIPGGTFMMGAPDGEAGRSGDEGPQHQVTVPSFYMGKYQVTQDEWRAVASLAKASRDLNPDPSHSKGNNRPVEQVSWEDAVEFCERLSRSTGKEYRLPSEAEWEYACRAGTTTPFAFGETITPDIVNYDGNYPYGSAPKGLYRESTIEVGSLGVANGFGLYDMHGNVWEWCLDNWHENYKGAPVDGSAWQGGDESLRVLRGGSWIFVGNNCRAADRYRARPDYRNYPFGFRVLSVVRTR